MKRVELSDVLSPWNGRERCGVWFPGDMYEMENLSDDQSANFKMSASDLRFASEEVGLPIVGLWHSHPAGKPEPSKTDYDFHPVGYALAIVCDGNWRFYDPETKILLGTSQPLSLTRGREAYLGVAGERAGFGPGLPGFDSPRLAWDNVAPFGE